MQQKKKKKQKKKKSQSTEPTSPIVNPESGAVIIKEQSFMARLFRAGVLIVFCCSLIALFEAGVRDYLKKQAEKTEEQENYSHALVLKKYPLHFLKLKYSYENRHSRAIRNRTNYYRVTPDFYEKVVLQESFKIKINPYFKKSISFEGRWLMDSKFITRTLFICLFSFLFLLPTFLKKLPKIPFLSPA